MSSKLGCSFRVRNGCGGKERVAFPNVLYDDEYIVGDVGGLRGEDIAQRNEIEATLLQRNAILL